MDKHTQTIEEERLLFQAQAEDPALIRSLSPRSVETASTCKTEDQPRFLSKVSGAFSYCYRSITEFFAADVSKSLMTAIFYLLGQVLICIALIVNWHTKTKGRVNITEATVEMLMVVYMTIGIIGISAIFMKANDSSFVVFITLEKQASKYLMGSVYAFGGGSLFMTAVYIFTYAHCPEDYNHVLFNVFRFIYTLLQMLFLQRFGLALFHRSALLVFFLIHILGTNICIWIYYLMEETKLLSYEPRDDKHVHCKNTSSVTQMADDWKEYLTPFSMEFCLICAGLLYSIVSSMKHFPEGNQPPVKLQLKQHEYTSLEERSCTISSSILNEYDGEARAKWQREILSKKLEPYSGAHPGFLIGVTISVVMIVSALVIENVNPINTQISHNSLLFHHIYLICVSISQIVAMCIITNCLKHNEYVKQNFRSDDTLLVISFAGLFGWEIMCMISAVGEFKYPKQNLIEAVFIFIHNLINLIACLVQCGVIIRTIRYRNRLKDAKLHLLWNKQAMAFKMFWISQAVVYLLMTNIGFWIVDSFFEIKHYGDLYYPVGKDFYDSKSWHFWSALLYPLIIFFRFHSATLLVEVWVRFRKGSKDKNNEETEPSVSRKHSLPSIETILFHDQEEKVQKERKPPKKGKKIPIRDPSDIYRKYWSK